MKGIAKDQLILTHIEFIEHLNDKLIWQIRKSPLDSFNLILGDNAQGKTRLFNLLRFLSAEHIGLSTVITPNLSTQVELTFSLGKEIIIYKFSRTIRVDGVIPMYSEEISRSGKLIFSRALKLLVEESTGRQIEKFFMPPNVPALLSIAGKEFPTIELLKSFFERMMFLEANRFTGSNIDASKGAIVLNSLGSNVGAVLDTWRQRMPSAYNEVVKEFIEGFSFVDSVTTKDDLLTEQRILFPFMFYTDKESKDEIRQNLWSDGMLRAIALFVLAASRFQKDNHSFLRPSLICIDEIDNGLDFSTLRKVISFYEKYSHLMQVVMTSHSPIACNLVEPKYWHIAKRKGVVCEFFSLKEKTLDLDEQRRKLLNDNWEFYKNHIAKSKLYVVK